ncbi:hypothetical protein FJY71_04545 [candidate division WOR-3 bacterium]|nr:hypothetical protein [candidate division WOR-3 bacterium]
MRQTVEHRQPRTPHLCACGETIEAGEDAVRIRREYGRSQFGPGPEHVENDWRHVECLSPDEKRILAATAGQNPA